MADMPADRSTPSATNGATDQTPGSVRPERVDASAGVTLAVSSRDLIWSTRIMGTAKELGVSCRNFPFLSQAIADAAKASPRVLMFDLGGVSASDVPQLASLRAALPAPVRIIAFGSHVDTAILHAAHAAGFDAVMARSEFSDRLLPMLRDLATG
jgi:hypothetical protein